MKSIVFTVQQNGTRLATVAGVPVPAVGATLVFEIDDRPMGFIVERVVYKFVKETTAIRFAKDEQTLTNITVFVKD